MQPQAVHRSTVRNGFTLVELLVAAALCVIIMYVMATAFKAGTDTLSQLKSIASLAEQLRTADTIMRRDLRADHLYDSTDTTVRRISSLAGTTPASDLGFFKVASDNTASPASVDEGSDSTLISSKRTTSEWLHFTSKLPGGSQSEMFAADAPPKFAQDPSSLSLIHI